MTDSKAKSIEEAEASDMVICSDCGVVLWAPALKWKRPLPWISEQKTCPHCGAVLFQKGLDGKASS